MCICIYERNLEETIRYFPIPRKLNTPWWWVLGKKLWEIQISCTVIHLKGSGLPSSVLCGSILCQGNPCSQGTANQAQVHLLPLPALNKREIIDFPFAVDAHIQNRESGRSWKGWAQISSTPYHKHFSWAQWNETQQRLNHLFPACPCQSYVHLFTLVFNVCFTQGKNSCFKVILRPLKEFKRFHEKVVFTLSRLVYPDT